MWFRLWDTALFNLDFFYFIMGIPMNQQVWDQELLRKLWGHGGGERSKLEYLGVEVQFRTRFIPDLVFFCLVCMCFFPTELCLIKKSHSAKRSFWGCGGIYIYVLYIDVFKHALSTHISIFHDIESTYIYIIMMYMQYSCIVFMQKVCLYATYIECDHVTYVYVYIYKYFKSNLNMIYIYIHTRFFRTYDKCIYTYQYYISIYK